MEDYSKLSVEELKKLDQIPGQEDLFEYFNEPEAFSDDSPEPDIKGTVVSGYTRKKETTREQNLEGLSAVPQQINICCKFKQ